MMKSSSLVHYFNIGNQNPAIIHDAAFLALEDATFKRFSGQDGMAPGTEVATMLRSLGFFPNAKQVSAFLSNKTSVTFAQFQSIVVKMERCEMEIESLAARLFIDAADWKQTGKIKTSQLKEICCSYGEKMDDKEWQKFMNIVNPKHGNDIQYMPMIKTLEGK